MSWVTRHPSMRRLTALMATLRFSGMPKTSGTLRGCGRNPPVCKLIGSIAGNPEVRCSPDGGQGQHTEMGTTQARTPDGGLEAEGL